MRTIVDVVPTAQAAIDTDLTGTTVLIIDVLRATTSICCALQSGARCVYPVESVEDARRMKLTMPDALLCGERGGLPPSGFDMGNSPAEFATAQLSNREIILTTTNGTVAVANAGDAAHVVAVSMLNVSSAAGHVIGNHRDISSIVIICAGTGGRFSIEDFYCAGLVVTGLVNSGAVEPTDFAWAASKLSERSVGEVVNPDTCMHLAFLLKNGFREDVELALSIESQTAGLSGHVPMLDRNTGGFVLGAV